MKRLLFPVLLTLLCCAAYGVDFWEKKDPAHWSPKEVQQLLSDSPWARQAEVHVGRGGEGGKEVPEGRQGGGMGWGDYGGHQGGKGGGMGGRPESQSGPPPGNGEAGSRRRPVLLRWLSARPISLALRKAHLEVPAGVLSSSGAEYVIAICGLPHREESGSGEIEKELAGHSALILKDGRVLTPSRITCIRQQGSLVVLCHFPTVTPLTLRNGEVEFRATLGSITVKGIFDLTAMKYRGKLAL